MARIRINGAVWDVGPRRPSAAARALGVAGRAAALAGALTALSVGLAGMGSPVEAARGAAPVAAPAKDGTRLGEASRVPPRLDLFAAVSLGAPTPLATGPAPAPTGFAAPPAPGAVEREFKEVTVADGRTLVAGGIRIRLADLDLPGADETCRTVDGRREPCGQRAATVLELTTRWRTVSCRYRLETATEGVGACRLGSSDLAERMLRTGLVRRAGEAPRRLASDQARAAD
ncbi:MAG TPA: hypothetical protein VEA41_19205 [Salinarimonas sp.]|jgi:hypothetical protein|nr:hypothetical protein [Salinarimonas sp.]